MNKSLTRRILAVYVVVCAVGVSSYLSILGISQAYVALTGALGFVLGFYFGTQQTK